MNVNWSIAARHFPSAVTALLVVSALTCNVVSTNDTLAPVHNETVAVTPVNKTDQREWHASSYQGLILGKSTKDDVERTFGKPVWAGPPEEELIDDGEAELLYEYMNVGGVVGQTTVVLGTRSNTVQAIGVYPQQPLTLQQAVTKYGKEYVERESKLGPCPTETDISNFKSPKEREYPIFIVYPRQGMYFSVSESGSVSHIGYLIRCP